MCKVLCASTHKAMGNIVEISQTVLGVYPNIPKMEITTPFHTIKPLVLWKVEKDNYGKDIVIGLDWWNAHNKLKHLNGNEILKATLDNAIRSLGSLFCIDLYVLQTIMGNLKYVDDYPSSYFKFSPYIFNGEAYNQNLPDFGLNNKNV